jgi:hypothetical protein
MNRKFSPAIVLWKYIFALCMGAAVFLGPLSCSLSGESESGTAFKMKNPKPLSVNTDSIEVWVEYGDKTQLLYSGSQGDVGFDGPYEKVVYDYNGENINLVIKEFDSGGNAITESTTAYVVEGGDIVNNTLLSIWPDNLVLYLDSGDVLLSSMVFPSTVDARLTWHSSDSAVATVSESGTVHALSEGQASIFAVLQADPSVADTVSVIVLATDTTGPEPESINITRDTLNLVAGSNMGILEYTLSPLTASAEVIWSSADNTVADVSTSGQVTPISVGETYVYARASLNNQIYDSVLVIVSEPLNPDSIGSVTGLVLDFLTGSPLSGIPVSIDGISSASDDNGTYFITDLQPGTYTLSIGGAPYNPVQKSGIEVTPGDTTQVPACSLVVVANQLPVIPSIMADTTISIFDFIQLTATAGDPDGNIVQYAWDFNGDNVYDDSGSVNSQTVNIVTGRQFDNPGTYNTVLRVKDDQGEQALKTVKITVVQDVPVARAGNDTDVIANTPFQLYGSASNQFGTIDKWEWKIGDAPFFQTSGPDTQFTVPDYTGRILCILRITDDDQNQGLDSMYITHRDTGLFTGADSAQHGSLYEHQFTSAEFKVNSPAVDSFILSSPVSPDIQLSKDGLLNVNVNRANTVPGDNFTVTIEAANPFDKDTLQWTIHVTPHVWSLVSEIVDTPRVYGTVNPFWAETSQDLYYARIFTGLDQYGDNQYVLKFYKSVDGGVTFTSLQDSVTGCYICPITLLKVRSLNNYAFFWYRLEQNDQNILRVFDKTDQLTDVKTFNEWYVMELDANGNIVLMDTYRSLSLYHYNPADTQVSSIAVGGSDMSTVHDIEILDNRYGYLINNNVLYHRPIGSGYMWRSTGITVEPGIIETDKNDGNVLYILSSSGGIQTVKDEVLSTVTTGMNSIMQMVMESETSGWIVAEGDAAGGDIYYTNDAMGTFHREFTENGPVKISRIFLSHDLSAVFAYGEGKLYRY